MSDFDKACDIILLSEGLYSNDPDDAGGETKHGIADMRDGKRDGMTDVDGDGIPDTYIKDLTPAQGRIIYKRDYWDVCKCDQLAWPLNLFVFDAAVNQGEQPAKKMLQRALNVKQDGILGKITMARAAKADKEQICLFMAYRAQRYYGTRGYDKYGNGWLKRLFVLSLEA